jgi:hypothetical protein
MSIPFLMFLALLLAVPDHVFAQGRSVDMPENARANAMGAGGSVIEAIERSMVSA